MKRRLSLLLTLAFCFSLLTSAQKSKYASAGMIYLNSHVQLYDSIQKSIHDLAELGYLEVKSSDMLKHLLSENSFSIKTGLANIPTAFVASYGNGHPVVALLAEYDALPGMSQDTVPYRKTSPKGTAGHACGHNLLGTGSVAAAIAVSKWLASGHSGTILLYGCPAEEGGGGKAYLARDHCFDGVDAVLDWHPSTENNVVVETGLANVQIDFRFKGIAAHASSSPEMGRSALDAVEAFDMMMNLMREHVPMTTRIHYIITNGGQAANIVPERAEVEYFLRSPKRTILADVEKRAIDAAKGAALGTGTQMTYEIKSGNYERLYNKTISQLMQRNLEYVGGVKYNSREHNFVSAMLKNSNITDTVAAFRKPVTIKTLAEEKETLTGTSTDVGNVSWVVPTAGVRIAAFAPAGNGHCWQQVSSGGTTIGTKGMMNAAKVLYLTCYDLLSNPKVVEQAKEEFNKRRGSNFQFVPLIGDRKPPLDYRLRK